MFYRIKRCLAAVMFLACLQISSAQAQQVLFSDDFKGVVVSLPGLPAKLYPDPAKWAFTFWPGTVWPDSFGDGTNWLAANGECQAYLTPLLTKVNGYSISPDLRYDPFTITPTGLSITAALLTPQQISAYRFPSFRRFGSGMLLSRFNFKYGTIKMVAKLPSARGSWPALWLLPSSKAWPPEIDILEGMAWGNHTKEIFSGLIVPPAAGPSPQPPSWFPIGVDPSAGFHEYRLDWRAGSITAYFDGRKMWQKTTPASMKQPMYMIINLAVGGRWAFNELGVTPIDGMSEGRLNAGATLIQGDYPASYIIKSITVTK
jgi:beta-glucanase (GH16 family)